MNYENYFKMKYLPARICKGKDLCIKYYVWDHVENKRKRKVMRFNYMRKSYPMREILRVMSNKVLEINFKLEQGIDPILEAKSTKSYTRMTDIFEVFLYIKEKEMRPDGFRSYKSFVKKLTDWIEKNNRNLYVIQFNKDIAVDYLTDLELDDNISARSWNNHLIFYRTLWNWMIEKNYCQENIFEGFKKKQTGEKSRKVIPDDIHKRVISYCRKNIPNMEIVIDLIRASFIRPAEICRLQISNLNLDEGVIEIPGSKSKNKNFRFAYLPDWLITKIKEGIQPELYPKDYFFITRNLHPGTKEIGSRELGKVWSKIREDLKLPMEYQLYSYRDTGITFLENQGIPRNVIQKLTDHHSEKMVGKYVGGPSRELMEGVVSRIV